MGQTRLVCRLTLVTLDHSHVFVSHEGLLAFPDAPERKRPRIPFPRENIYRNAFLNTRGGMGMP